MRGYQIGLIGVLAIAVGGCATMANGSRQSIHWETNPSGAEVVIDGRVRGTTPLTVALDRSSFSKTVEVRKAGYTPKTCVLDTAMSGWFWGDAYWSIIGIGFLSSTTDMGTNAMYQYEPDRFFLSLDPASAQPAPGFGDVARDPHAKTADFIVTNYPNLQTEIATGSGEHLQTLFGLLQIAGPDEQRKALKRLMELYIEHATAPDFARAVVADLQR